MNLFNFGGGIIYTPFLSFLNCIIIITIIIIMIIIIM